MRNLSAFLGAFAAVVALVLVLAVDTPRSQADILALFPDNTAGSISAQDIRDFVVSQHQTGDIRTDKGATGGQTTNATPGAYDIITQFDENGPCTSALTCDHTSDNIAVGFSGVASVSVSMSFTGTNNAVMSIRIYVEGVASTCQISRELNIGGTSAAISIGPCNVAVNNGDTIDLRVASDGASDSFVMENAQLWVNLR